MPATRDDSLPSLVWQGLCSLGRGLREFLLEALGEAAAALLACALLAGLVAASAWGFAESPRATGVMLGVLAVTAAYGGWVLSRGGSARRSVLARVAVGWFVALSVWAFFVLTYCSCL